MLITLWPASARRIGATMCTLPKDAVLALYKHNGRSPEAPRYACAPAVNSAFRLLPCIRHGAGMQWIAFLEYLDPLKPMPLRCGSGSVDEKRRNIRHI